MDKNGTPDKKWTKKQRQYAATAIRILMRAQNNIHDAKSLLDALPPEVAKVGDCLSGASFTLGLVHGSIEVELRKLEKGGGK